MSDEPGTWPFYCEENIWRLCADVPPQEDGALVAVISNAGRSVAMANQQAARSERELIVWDYHVILLRPDPGHGWWVIDPGTTLGSPVEALTYLQRSFPKLPRGRADLTPRFRLVAAETYRFALQTDRRHMRTADGGFRAEPPPWPTIGEGSNLEQFIDLTNEFLGRVVDLDELRAHLSQAP